MKLNRFLFALSLGYCLSFSAYAADDDPFSPEGHVKIERPADLDAADASAIYREIAKRMAEGYAQSDYADAKVYQQWTKQNSAPYLSPGHGNRFLNNYGNAIAKGYLALDVDEKMPVGSILAKDSFTVTDNQEIFAGALFLMEKLEEGKHPATGDWRYAMILPDGSLIGDTLGDDPDSMTFCHDCHEQVADTDFLFGIPAKFINEEAR